MITRVSSSEKILQLFFEYPEKKFHLRELAKLTGLSIAGVIKIVPRLKEAKLLKSRKERVVELVEADKDGRFLVAKRANNLVSLYDSGLVEKLNDFYEMPRCIVVFGSYAEGTDVSTSDIDITVVTKLENEADVEEFEKKLKRKINVLTVDLAKSKPGFINSLANGVVLSGFLEVVK